MALGLALQTRDVVFGYAAAEMLAFVRPILVAMLAFSLARSVQADPVRSAPKAQSEKAQQKLARQHFDRALAYYRRGQYRPAIAELNQAILRDPKSKDLFYNLAIVHEKLGELEPAVASMQHYLALESDPIEMARARFAISRMQGAERERLKQASLNEDREMGRLDGWVVGASSVALLGAIVGTIFGVTALATQAGDEKTDADTSIDDLRDRAERAHTYAVIADAAFAVGIASGAAAATLYFGRPRESTLGNAGSASELPKAALGSGIDLTLAVTF